MWMISPKGGLRGADCTGFQGRPAGTSTRHQAGERWQEGYCHGGGGGGMTPWVLGRQLSPPPRGPPANS